MSEAKGFIDRYFGISENGSTIGREMEAGLTTFMTMAYILAVNPGILSAAGLDAGAVFTATALSALVATLVMGLYANLPFALAPGMGLNAFFAFSVVLGMGKSWQFALTAVFLEGLIFILLTFLNVREAIINSIPLSVKRAISVGIGLFIAFIGFSNAGVVVANDATKVALGDITSGTALLALVGVIITGVLLTKGVKGAILLGILATTLLGIPFGITQLPSTLFQAPPSISGVFMKFEWTEVFTTDMFTVLLVFLLVDMFDTVGTLVGVATKADMLTEDGKVPRAKQALFADAVGTTFGAMVGTSTVTTYVESASGVAEGGRTGLTAVSTGLFFALSLVMAPLFLAIPSAATAPALIIVGAFMMSPIKEINFDDMSDLVPAFVTMIMMPLTYSISDGLALGILSYIAIKVLSFKFEEVPVLTYIIGALFIVKFLI